jgi:hypothetical protein
MDLVMSKSEVLALFVKAKEQPNRRFRIKILDEHIYFDVLNKDSHFWSPHLHMEVLEEGPKVTIKGLFGPKPQVWTFFMFLHFVIATLFVGCCIWVYVGSTLEKTNVFPIVMMILLPVLWIVLYLFGRLGRDFGAKQTKKMQNFLLELLTKEQD